MRSWGRGTLLSCKERGKGAGGAPSSLGAPALPPGPGEAWQGGAAHKMPWNLHPPLSQHPPRCERLIWWFFPQDSKNKKAKKGKSQ